MSGLLSAFQLAIDGVGKGRPVQRLRLVRRCAVGLSVSDGHDGDFSVVLSMIFCTCESLSIVSANPVRSHPYIARGVGMSDFYPAYSLQPGHGPFDAPLPALIIHGD